MRVTYPGLKKSHKSRAKQGSGYRSRCRHIGLHLRSITPGHSASPFRPANSGRSPATYATTVAANTYLFWACKSAKGCGEAIFFFDKQQVTREKTDSSAAGFRQQVLAFS
jgi:hypothetical protein